MQLLKSQSRFDPRVVYVAFERDHIINYARFILYEGLGHLANCESMSIMATSQTHRTQVPLAEIAFMMEYAFPDHKPMLKVDCGTVVDSHINLKEQSAGNMPSKKFRFVYDQDKGKVELQLV